MSSEPEKLKPVLPQHGMLFQEHVPGPVLCKPRLLPLKSFTLERLETLQRDAEDAVKKADTEARMQAGAVLYQAEEDAGAMLEAS
ncbi:hypothetical protein BOX15_Mlig016799g1 [Macrostomum lignano]|uniref:BBSome-interacting protein 1 n=1 Tax=Macrostomum lignano TaxID=282301 RepID=A0A267EJ62_9PLAT|nr:hypothetical protein BOX15_Mlig019062g2 [Macrostomum lignano]PAA61538.1 hypothetical protein BOX15_Mlig019062g1 [Macrostomum lignano]PAA88062.1 hypothetical protein BOX15_Mlig016799g1 [Macrostomum lignano]